VDGQRLPNQGHPVNGPFSAEAEASATAAVRTVYDAFDRHPVVGGMEPHNYQMLADAIAAAGVELGAYDDRIVHWLAMWEPTTCAVIAGIVSRAAAGRPPLTPADTRTVVDALDVAADYKRDAADVCGDYPDGDLCGTCDRGPVMTARYVFGGIDGRGNSRTGVTLDSPASFASKQYSNGWRQLEIRTDDESRHLVGAIGPDPATTQRTWWAES
jgi:hypothetical protein